MELLKAIIWIFIVIFVIAAIVGIFLCGINVIKFIFGEGGSYTAAITGFLMAVIGSIFANLFNSGTKD